MGTFLVRVTGPMTSRERSDDRGGGDRGRGRRGCRSGRARRDPGPRGRRSTGPVPGGARVIAARYRLELLPSRHRCSHDQYSVRPSPWHNHSHCAQDRQFGRALSPSLSASTLSGSARDKWPRGSQPPSATSTGMGDVRTDPREQFAYGHVNYIFVTGRSASLCTRAYVGLPECRDCLADF